MEMTSQLGKKNLLPFFKYSGIQNLKLPIDGLPTDINFFWRGGRRRGGAGDYSVVCDGMLKNSQNRQILQIA